MNPNIALALCLVFIVWLFLTDRRANGRQSPGLWLALVWGAIVASRPLTLWFSPSEINATDVLLEGSPLDRDLLLLLMGLATSTLLVRPIAWGRFIRENRLVLLYFAFMACSVLWSDYTLIAFRRWIKDAGLILLVLLVLSESDPILAVRRFLTQISFIFVPLSITAVKYFPTLSVYYDRWIGHPYISGLCTDKNMLGMTLCILGLANLWELAQCLQDRRSPGGRRLAVAHVIVLAMIYWLLERADCATAVLTIILAVTAWWLLGMTFIRRHLKVWLVISALGATLLMFPDLRHAAMEPFLSLVGRKPSFTGRDVLWQLLLRVDVNPLIGDGGYSFWMRNLAEPFLPLEFGYTNSAHNAYLEVYLNVGLIGLGLYVAMLVVSAGRAVRELQSHSQPGYARFRLVVVIAVAFYGMTEAVVRATMPWLSLLLCLVTVPSKRKVATRRLETYDWRSSRPQGSSYLSRR